MYLYVIVLLIVLVPITVPLGIFILSRKARKGSALKKIYFALGLMALITAIAIVYKIADYKVA